MSELVRKGSNAAKGAYAVTKICPVCGKSFDAKRATAKYDTATCRVAASRAGLAVPRDGNVSEQGERLRSRLVRSTRKELATAGKTESTAGDLALVLAEALTNAPAATVAGLSREYRAALAAALAEPAGEEKDELDSILDDD